MKQTHTINSDNHDELIHLLKTTAGDNFAEQILTDLLKEDLSGEKLLTELKKRQAQIRPAAEALLAKAEDIAGGRAKYATYEDVFGADD